MPLPSFTAASIITFAATLHTVQPTSHAFSTSYGAPVLTTCQDAEADLNPVSNAQIATELGFSPEVMVVAGFHNKPTFALDTIAQSVQLRASYRQHRAASKQALEQVQSIKSQLIADSANLALVEQLASAQAAVDLASSQLKATQDALRSAILADMDARSAEVIERIFTCRRDIPLEMRVADRTPQQWGQIAKAIRAETRAQRLQRVLAETHADLLTDLRSDPDVTAASVRLSSYLDQAERSYRDYPED